MIIIFFFHSALSSILVILEDRMYMHLPDCVQFYIWFEISMFYIILKLKIVLYNIFKGLLHIDL